jgi:hypothetical protein
MPNAYAVTIEGRTFTRSTPHTYTHAVAARTVAGVLEVSFHGSSVAAEKNASRLRGMRFDKSVRIRGGGAPVYGSAVVLPVEAR